MDISTHFQVGRRKRSKVQNYDTILNRLAGTIERWARQRWTASTRHSWHDPVRRQAFLDAAGRERLGDPARPRPVL